MSKVEFPLDDALNESAVVVNGYRSGVEDAALCDGVETIYESASCVERRTESVIRMDEAAVLHVCEQ